MIRNSSLDTLNDNALLSQFADLVRRDHEGNADLLRHIDVIERRKLWAKQGHSSLFRFLVNRHHMSEATAFKRIGAARTARRFPVLFAMVACGEIHLSGIHRLKSHLTPDNHEHVLALAKHKTIREIEALVARLAPRPDVPTTLRALPNRTTNVPTPAAPAPAAAPAAPMLPAPAAVETAPGTLRPRRDPDPAPLSPGRYRLQVTISQDTHDKLEQLRDLLAHKMPNGDPAAIIEHALNVLLVKVRKRKIGLSDRPRVQKSPDARARSQPEYLSMNAGAERSRHVPAAERREVWPRDEGRCGFVSDDGHRCNETRGLEFAHIQPWAKGGANTADNLCLRCPAHNALEADRDYGTDFMARKREQKPLKVREPLTRYVLPNGPGRCGTPSSSQQPLKTLAEVATTTSRRALGGSPLPRASTPNGPALASVPRSAETPSLRR